MYEYADKEKYMLDRINVAYSQQEMQGALNHTSKFANIHLADQSTPLSKCTPDQIHVPYLPFFPDIPAITITNQKNGCLQFISVKLSARSASTAARCAWSHRITFLHNPIHQKCGRNQSIRKPDIKKAGMNLINMKHIKQHPCVFFFSK